MSEFLGDRLYRIGKASQRLGVATSTGYLVEYEKPRNTLKKCLKCGKLTSCKTQTFVCKHYIFTINRQIQAPLNIAEKYLNNGLKKSNKSKNVASSVSAEMQLMKTMLGELREFKERIVRDASQYDELYHSISLLSA